MKLVRTVLCTQWCWSACPHWLGTMPGCSVCPRPRFAKALSEMKCSKAAGPSGIAAEVLNATGEEGVELMIQLTEAVLSCTMIQSDCEESFIMKLYRDKCEALTETEMLSFWWNFHHWLHEKLSFWQLLVQPVTKISSKWRHFRFSAWSWQLSWSQTHRSRSSHEAAGMGTRLQYSRDGEYWWDAVLFCAWQRYHWRHLHCSPAAGEVQLRNHSTLPS